MFLPSSPMVYARLLHAHTQTHPILRGASGTKPSSCANQIMLSPSLPQHHPSPWALSCRLWDVKEVSLNDSLWMQMYHLLTATWGQVGNFCAVVQTCIVYGYKGGFDKGLHVQSTSRRACWSSHQAIASPWHPSAEGNHTWPNSWAV